jgi:dipeptidyl aminopeptidase/acylaminoacyl peptidase
MIFRLLLALGSVPFLVDAAPKRVLEFRDIIELNEPSQPRISPDGNYVAFLLSRPSVESNATRRSLWLASRQGSVRLVLGEAVIGPVEWAADSASLIGRLTRPGKVAFWKVPVNGGAPEPLFQHENPILSAWWSPDRSQVLFTSAQPISAEDRQRPAREGLLYDETIHGIRNFTGRHRLGAAVPRVGDRDCFQQGAGVRMPGMLVNICQRAQLRHLPQVEHADPVTNVLGRSKVMGDE